MFLFLFLFLLQVDSIANHESLDPGVPTIRDLTPAGVWVCRKFTGVFHVWVTPSSSLSSEISGVASLSNLGSLPKLCHWNIPFWHTRILGMYILDGLRFPPPPGKIYWRSLAAEHLFCFDGISNGCVRLELGLSSLGFVGLSWLLPLISSHLCWGKIFWFVWKCWLTAISPSIACTLLL